MTSYTSLSAAVYQLLSVELDGSAGVYNIVVPQTVTGTGPRVIFQLQGGTDVDTLADRAISWDAVHVKASVQGTSAIAAESLLDECDAALQDAQFDIAGQPILVCRRTQTLGTFAEIAESMPWMHAAAIYRIGVQG